MPDIRISSEDQVGNFSIDAQKRAIETWVRTQVSMARFSRPMWTRHGQDVLALGLAFRRCDTLHAKSKFDRFARNRTDALAIKSLLRYDYGVKVFSVSEPSEDSDDPMGALIEGIMESVADWYSQNLARETTKGKRERTLQDFHNNQPPFGMRKAENDVLVAYEAEIAGLKLAFNQYAAGRYSNGDIAQLLNREGYQTKTNRPFTKEIVRFMLQNRT